MNWPIGDGPRLPRRLRPPGHAGPPLRAGRARRTSQAPVHVAGSTTRSSRRLLGEYQHGAAARRTSSSSTCAGDEFDRRARSARRADAGVLRQRVNNFGVEPFLTPSSSCAAAARAAEQRPRPDRARRPTLHRLRLQDPGEHGPRATATASRSCASCSGRFEQGHEGPPRAARTGDVRLPRAAPRLRAGARDRRGGLSPAT